MPKKQRPAPLLQPVSGIQPTISEVDDGDPAKYVLGCPSCGTNLGRHRFLPLARRTFEEHVDEEHPAVAGPLDQVRTLVDLAETGLGTWVCKVAGSVYSVYELENGKYRIENPSLSSTIEADTGCLDEARIVIGRHVGVVSAALGLAAAIATRRTAPDNAISLD